MTAVEATDPNARRLPRRGDKVVAAPKAPDCVSGEVISYSDKRIAINTRGPEGKVYMEMTRFTWSTRRRAWVCWPKDVIAISKRIDQDEARLIRVIDYAQIGMWVLYHGRVCWVMRHQTKPVPLEKAKAVGSKLRAYILSTPHGPVTLPAEDCQYDSQRRMWIGREGLAA